MDEEENFAKLLSQSTTAAAPAWNSPAAEADPWANPFSDSTPSSNPFASPFGASSTYVPAPLSDPYTAPAASLSTPQSPHDGISPYVSKIEEDVRGGPDMPSVIAAREQAAIEPGFGGEPRSSLDDDDIPFGQVRRDMSKPPAADKGVQRKTLPSDLIDDELLAASDPSLSLKKAFVKSTPSAMTSSPSAKRDAGKTDEGGKPKTYVFTPTKKGSAAREAKEPVNIPAASEGKESAGAVQPPDATDAGAVNNDNALTSATEPRSAQTSSAQPSSADTSTPKKAASIPLPDSVVGTPSTARALSPAPVPPAPPKTEKPDQPEPSPLTAKTPSIDRVAVSPLDAPPQESDYGFHSLAIGASSIAPPVPPKSPLNETATEGWSTSKTTPVTSNSPASRFGGKGWGALDDEDDGGLFGKGGPSVRSGKSIDNDPWGNGVNGEGGWGEPGVSSLPTPPAGSSNIEEESQEAAPSPTTATSSTSTNTSGTQRVPKVLSKPLFQISVGDPTRVGDPVRGYTVYTVRTRTTSPHYRKGEFSVLRRFSDFLWLFETLTMNNPGVIVPPVPDKHPFGRFQDTFIETRRLALQRCLTKITAHPVLQLDPDLRLFLESDHFATESKSRRAEFQDGQQQANKGLLSSWTGPKFVEQDEWFDTRRAFLDSLESQLRSLSKSIETAGKQRLDMAIAMGDFAGSINALADSDLGSAMCAALARLGDLATREKEANEEQAKAEVVHLLNLADEYVRFIGSVRLAFASRVKCYERWQAAEKEVGRVRAAREKARQQGKLGDRGPQSVAEIGEAERRSRDANHEFDAVSKLVKSEFGRFERERVEEFKKVLEKYLDGMIARQKELIDAWEEYHGVVLRMVQKSQGQNGPA